MRSQTTTSDAPRRITASALHGDPRKKGTIGVTNDAACNTDHRATCHRSVAIAIRSPAPSSNHTDDETKWRPGQLNVETVVARSLSAMRFARPPAVPNLRNRPTTVTRSSVDRVSGIWCPWVVRLLFSSNETRRNESAPSWLSNRGSQSGSGAVTDAFQRLPHVLQYLRLQCCSPEFIVVALARLRLQRHFPGRVDRQQFAVPKPMDIGS